MPTYHILITRRDARIVSIYSPDFNAQLLDSEDLTLDMDLRSYVEIRLAALSLAQPTFQSQALEDLNRRLRPVHPYQTWQAFEIAPMYRGFFSKYVPVFAMAANISSIVASSFMTFMATQITISDQENIKSVLAAGVGLFLGLINYNYSEAPAYLRHLGHKLDESIKSIWRDPWYLLRGIDRKTVLKLMIGVVVIGIILTNWVIAANLFYQQAQLLKNAYLILDRDASPEALRVKGDLISWFVIDNLIVSSFIGSMAFQAIFINRFIGDVTQKIENIVCPRPLSFMYNSIRSRQSSRPDNEEDLIERVSPSSRLTV